MATCSSSDEDEEERKKFAELAGIANKDISDAMGKIKSKQSTIPTRSLRMGNTDDQETNDGITPEFKKHVSKMLSSYMESYIEEETPHPKKTKKKKKKKKNQYGIHLFNLSKEEITEVEEDNEQKSMQTKSRKKHVCPASDSSDDDEALARFAEAAVCGQSIIDNGLSGTLSNHEEDNKSQVEDTKIDTEQNTHKQKKKKKKKKWKDEENDEHHKRKKHKKSC